VRATLEPKVAERHISTFSVAAKELSVRTISDLMSLRFVLGGCRLYCNPHETYHVSLVPSKYDIKTLPSNALSIDRINIFT